ncbi:uncharacterized protein K460DRAFT_357797 [Cucurbitaria berberidis CBS 394.84]|uniref:Uncharacterized protein n=1 Tax=Cucurbitaria berberidis CBS 394.84 TaxID=1168544 RepID=A0A9P4L6T8_9PLEO|nr:uncharacterized protein K460DRAFT_357797 [Cucurbitaria berberidis CBS 394.84]KAF1844175.1 hypothetical protein K460DRAFT_357797 [Cucurbitaria berberidis CBS 394.84]
MEKIKNVVSGHRKSEDATHTSPSTATGSEQHPIFDQMTGHKEGNEGTLTSAGGPYAQVQTTSGEPYTALAQPSDSPGHHGHARPEHVATGSPIGASNTTSREPIGSSSTTTGGPIGGSNTTTGGPIGSSNTTSREPIGGSSTTSGGNIRPDYPTGKDHLTAGISDASIKSGVIGFGAGERQEHAALSTHNPTEQYMDRNQVVGGGNPGTAAMTEGKNLTSTTGAEPHSHSGTTQRDPTGTNVGGTTAQQPYDNTLRQQSYTADTDRSFPLAGGVASRQHPHEHTLPTQHKTVSEREPGTKEREAGLHKGHGREGLAGAATAATVGGVATQRPHEHTSSTQHKPISEREPGTKEREVGVHEGHGREGLAGAAAVATTVGASKALSHSEERNVKDQGLETRQATYGNVPPATSSNTSTGPIGSTTGSTTHHHNPEALAAATAAASKSSTISPSAQQPGYGTQDRSVPGASQSATSSGPAFESFGALNRDRPHGTRSASHRHVPGEFPSPTPGDESKTFLDYHSVVEPTSASGAPIGQHSAVEPTPTIDGSTGSHELRHTGSLEQPQSKSSDIHEEHHHGRDAALAGGLGAGAAGLGTYAASQKHATSDTGNKPLYEEASPYSSKTIDPRVLGTKAKLEEQRFDPQAQSETLPHHAAQTSNPTGISAASGPTASHGTAKTEDPQHHYGRDAALVGAGAATAGGLHHTLQRDDTPGTGTAALPPNASYPSAPLSSSAIPQQSSNTSAGIAPQQRSPGNDTFYGTPGAPAPVVSGSSPQQQPLSNLGHTSTSGPTAIPDRDPQHHYGRDATLAGAGAATAGGLYAATRDNKANTGPASSTIGPHDSNIANVLDPRVQPDPSKQVHHNVGPTSQDPASRTVGPHDGNIANIVDPRVQPDPSKQKGHTTTGPHQSDSLNRADPRVDEKAGEHHYGRDAAVVGGTGAAGYGAYEAAKAYGEHRNTQPGASINEQRYGTTDKVANTSNTVPTQSQYNYNDPSTASNVNRNTALGTGAGLGAAGAGAGAYAGSKHADNTQNLPLHQKQDFAYSAAPGSVPQSGSTGGTIAPHNTHTQDPVGNQHYNPSQDRSEQHHDKRDAALLGTAGAAAAGGGAYAYSQHQDAERERARLEKEQQERLKHEAHDREKEQHRLDKEQHKHEKEAHKLEKEQHKHDKGVVAAQHKHDKDVAAYEKEQHHLETEQHKRDKEAEKEAHRLEKEREGGEKKKGGLLGFLHRDKSKKETPSPETSPRHSKEYSPRDSKEYAAAGTAGALGAGTTAAAYGEEQDPESPRWKGKNRLHKDPPPGHPAREALENQNEGQGELYGGKREHVGIDGPIGNPNLISGDRETQKGVYGGHEIHDTGNLSAGTGGADANPNIGGYHNAPSAPGHHHQTAANPEAIRKADTPY